MFDFASPPPSLPFLLPVPFLFIFPLFFQVRQLAREKQPPAAFLKECDVFRDEVMPALGIEVQDQNDKPTFYAHKDPAVLLKVTLPFFSVLLFLKMWRRELERRERGMTNDNGGGDRVLFVFLR